MAGDNDLSGALLSDLGEMEAVGTSRLVNVVVQIDTAGGTTKRLLVRRGKSFLIEDLGEKNMAERQTLTEFIQWAAGQYPASRYALILSSHGDGLAKQVSYYHPELKQGRILQDDTDGVSCCLSNTLVRQAIEDGGIYFDLLGFDASMMGQTETAYEFRNLADILVFSQEIGQANGWDYTAIFKALKNDPFIEGEPLSRVIVDSYRTFYEEIFYPGSDTPDKGKIYTISAIRLGSTINDLALDLDHLAALFIEGLRGEDTVIRGILMAAIGEARNNTQELNSTAIPYIYVDLFDLMERLRDSLKHQETGEDPLLLKEVEDRVEAIITRKNDSIISEYHGAARPGSNGLSITFFRLPEAAQYRQYYEISRLFDPYTGEGNQIQFFHDFRWDGFLQAYIECLGNMHETCGI
ncbi:MAG: hypothetical protein IT392_04595 [Nitrospirae bacterium]|nr:hypothetical protein [Nitrospirota bacterium]